MRRSPSGPTQPRREASALRFCVVVPMWNEEAGAERCVRAICRQLRQLPYAAELLVVDDGSTDRTGEILASLAAEYPELGAVSHARNGGYGMALRTAIAEAWRRGFEYALFMDSDLTNDPAYIADFAGQMLQGYDVIKASRYVPGGRTVGVPARRIVLSVIGNIIARLLFRLPIRDCTNGFQAMRVEILRRMPLAETSFPIIMEQLYYAKFLARSFCELPYTLTARPESVRKSSFLYRPAVFRSYLKWPVKAFLGIPPKRMAILPVHAS